MLALARPQGGFTLVELLVTMAILSIVLVPLTSGFISGMNNYQSLSDRASSFEAGLVAINQLQLDIHCATSAGTNTAGDTLTLNINRNTCNAILLPTSQSGLISIQWCTVANSTGTYDLYRDDGGTACGDRSTLKVQSLTTPDVFSLPTANYGEFSTVKVTLPVNPNNGRDPNATYKISARITLRNSSVCNTNPTC